LLARKMAGISLESAMHPYGKRCCEDREQK
jgi:hypothetical protein